MNVEDTASAIKSMKIRGAGRIARSASESMAEYAKSYTGNDKRDFIIKLNEKKDILLSSRPTAVSLYNGVMSSIKGIDNGKDIDDIRRIVIENSEAFVNNSENAVKIIGKYGADLVDDGDTLLTHCNSSAAVSVIRTAYEQGKDIKVFATETRPWGQGFITVNEIAEAGIDVTLVVDSAVRSVMDKVDKVFVGADTITADGTLINKIGTSQIALIANEFNVPFRTCAETYKFSPLTLKKDDVEIELRDVDEIIKGKDINKKVKIHNPVFDRTPGKYIDAIITERGLIKPSDVRRNIIEIFGEGEQ